MYSKDDYRILQLRNEASLYLDDLVALVTNSTVADQLRSFSLEVMALTPGFTFGQKQARELRTLTEKQYRLYKAGQLTDVDLMNYQKEANAILKGDSIQNGGKQVGFFDKLLHGKEIRREEALKVMERDLQEALSKIQACEEKMKHCIAESKGHSPDSAVYRNNERTWRAENERLKLLNMQTAQLFKTLGEADRVRMIREHGEQIKRMNESLKDALGGEKELARLQAEVEMQSDKLESSSTRFENFGESIFTSAQESQQVSTSSEFGAQVAAEERRQNVLDFSALAAGEAPMTESASAANDPFAAQVNSRNAD